MGATRSSRRRKGEPSSTFESKWGWGPLSDGGWCVVPLALLEYGARIGLCPEEGWLIVQILSFKWNQSPNACSLELLARRFGSTLEEVHSLLRQLDSKGFLRLVAHPNDNGQVMNWELDFSPLMEYLAHIVIRGGKVEGGSLGLRRPLGVNQQKPPAED